MTSDRVRVLGSSPLRPERDFVLYWMIAARRTTWSPALDRALAHARELGRPLVVLEPLRLGHRWASPRIHRFVVEGMADQARRFEAAGVRYHAFVERTDGEGRGLLAALGARACVVVTDWFPAFFLPTMVNAAAERLDVRLEAVDGNGILPLSASPRVFTTAASFRRHLQQVLAPHLERFPSADPLAGYDLGRAVLPGEVEERWPHAAALIARPDLVSGLLDGPAPVPFHGGSAAGDAVVERFIAHRLGEYPERNHPDREVSSGLSPYLHFGHVSPHDVVSRIFEREDWDPGKLGPVTGSREGWWGMSAAAEGFMDEIVTWRELGYVFCENEPRYDRFHTLPAWAQTTLEKHAADLRPVIHDLETLAAAKTEDPLWNAAQRQLVAEGRIHNYLRMLWGKKILAWTDTPQIAWDTLVELNNRYAIDGRNPNSYSGIAWTFGRFDRAWGPERPIYGKVRYLSSDSTRRKLDLAGWLARWGPDGVRSGA